jgi:hypothetical protein
MSTLNAFMNDDFDDGTIELNQYVLFEKIGQGAQGEVFLASDTQRRSCARSRRSDGRVVPKDRPRPVRPQLWALWQLHGSVSAISSSVRCWR